MKLRWTFVLVAACGHAPPAAPQNHAQIVDAAALESHCFQGDQTLAPPLPDDATPTASYVDGSDVRSGPYWYCDLPDRVVLVDQTRKQDVFTGDVVVIPRATPHKLAHDVIAPGSSCTDPCGNDGWAGCSQQETCTLTSNLTHTIATGVPTPSPFGAVQTIDGAVCAPMTGEGVIAACATPTRSIFVREDACNGDDQTDPTEWEMVGLVYDGAAVRGSVDADALPAPTDTITGGVPTGDGSSWTYRFGDDAALVFHLGPSPSASFTYDGTTEDCFAFAINPY